MNLMEKTAITGFISIFIFLIILLVFALWDLFFGFSCKNKYEDSKYNIYWGCKVMYQWEYIPELIYRKAFETNIKLRLWTTQ